MKLAERDVALVLSSEGHEVMRLSAVNVQEDAASKVGIEDTDDIGLWIRVPRGDGEHLLLVRWEYVMSIDFPAGETRQMMGIKTT
jgi:hypothetical protein